MKYLAGFLLLVILFQAYLIYQFAAEDVDAESLDTNSDGVDDYFFEYKDSGSVVYFDRNKDGKIDEMTILDDLGMPLKFMEDDDFNETYESTSYYKNGVVDRTEVDFDGDGAIDYLFVYKHGVISEAISFSWSGTEEEGAKVPAIKEVYEFKFGFPYLGNKNNWSHIKVPEDLRIIKELPKEQ